MADGIFKDCFEGSQGVMERGETERSGGERCPPVLLPLLYIGFFPLWVLLVNNLKDCNSMSKCLGSAKLDKGHAVEIVCKLIN